MYLQEGDLVTHRTVGARQYGRFLIDVFEEWARHDVGDVFVSMFATALAHWMGMDQVGLCVHARTCGDAVAQPPLHANRTSQERQYAGPKDRFTTTPDGEPGLHYLCEGYQDFFGHVDAPMRVMAGLLRQGRDASGLRDWYASDDAKRG